MSDLRWNMHPERLEAIRKMLVEERLTTREIYARGVGGQTLVRAKMLLGIETRADKKRNWARIAEEKKRAQAEAEDLAAAPPGVPVSELSIGRCVWLVSQSPRLFCGKTEHPECKPYCLACDRLARQNRKPLISPMSTNATGRRSGSRRA